MRGRMTRLIAFSISATMAFCGCGEALLNLTASFGAPTAGQRGNVGVVIINNTPHRAVFTLGSYDQTDPDSRPDFDQYDLNDRGLVLEGDEAEGILAFECGRVFSLGGPRLLALIAANLPDADTSDEALIEGVEFFSVDPDNPDADPVSEGTAAPFEALLGVDFPCNALLIFRLEINDGGQRPFRVDFELIPSESTR